MDELQKAHDYIKQYIPFEPKVALVLGSGLGNFANRLNIEAEISYKDIPGFPVSTVAGHDGKFIFAKIEEIPVVVMKGRVHYYEGYTMQQVVMPIRLMHLLGAQTLVLTNAAGGMNPGYCPGDLVRITDHITSFVPSPLIGKNDDRLGERFPDMSKVYDEALGEKLVEIAEKENIRLKEGVYLQTTGPNYETPAEIRMYRNLGGDCVGMSTACEAMAARHMKMRVVGVSCITNMAAGMQKTALNHAEVQETANRIAQQFETLIYNFISQIG
ncbi:MAG: purine-nucleoside phosphorylase [Wujia sp.]